jgi:hypothetical protein
MKRLPSSLLKYLALLLAVIAVTGHLLFHAPGRLNLIILLCVFAGLYIFLSVTEFLEKLAKSQLPYDRFFYLPFSLLSVKVIKLGAFAIAGFVLLLSDSQFSYLGLLLIILLVADMLVFFLRLTRKVYYVSLFANYILFALEDETKLFASQVEVVEFRYDIFYLKTKQNRAFSIELARLRKQDRAAFTDKFVLWVVCNKLTFTPEAKQKLSHIISETL